MCSVLCSCVWRKCYYNDHALDEKVSTLTAHFSRMSYALHNHLVNDAWWPKKSARDAFLCPFFIFVHIIILAPAVRQLLFIFVSFVFFFFLFRLCAARTWAIIRGTWNTRASPSLSCCRVGAGKSGNLFFAAYWVRLREIKWSTETRGRRIEQKNNWFFNFPSYL